MSTNGSTDTTLTPFPAPVTRPSEIAHERATQLVTNITSLTTERLQQTIDQLVALQHELQRRTSQIVEVIGDHAGFAEHTMKSCSIVDESVKAMREQLVATEPRASIGAPPAA